MATFAVLLERLRREVIGEDSRVGGGWEDADLLDMMYASSAEIAAELGFPVGIDSTITLSEDDTSFTAPSDMIRGRSLLIGTNRVRWAQYDEVLKMRKFSGPPRVFSFDPLRGGNVEIAPAADAAYIAGQVILEYQQSLDTSAYTNGSIPWGGRNTEFHYLIPLHAGERAWEMVDDAPRALYFKQRYRDEVRKFAAYLGVRIVEAPQPQQGGEA